MISSQKLMILSACVLFTFSCKKEDEESPPEATVGCFEMPVYSDQLPNLDFEDWGSRLESGGKYEEPCGGVWATGNGGTALAGEIATSKTSDAQNGNYAVKMTTVSALGVLSGGSVYAGTFKLDISDPRKSAKLGMPFTMKPLGMTGYYKYTPVNGDSSNIIILLTKFNTATGRRDTVGVANQVGYDEVTSYTVFDLVIDYNYSASSEKPDTVVVNFTASKAAEFFQGEVGSTFIIDNCKFTY